ncbi:MAG: hypothetical protein GX222_08950 [Ruminococcaceae bacterium]|nr:hypothetical protein [Oscillospiraceae bacterium]
MERKFLEALGLEKEVIDKVMAEHGKDVEKHKQQLTDLTGERDSLKTQLEEVGKKLETFEGVDPEALKKEIETLKSDISAKEADFQAQLADRDFQALLNSGISDLKGKNQKAIIALLDVDTLKASKNQKEDISNAVKTLQESDPYLFEAMESKETPASVSTGGTHTETNNTGGDAFTAAAMKAAGLETGKEK